MVKLVHMVLAEQSALCKDKKRPWTTHLCQQESLHAVPLQEAASAISEGHQRPDQVDMSISWLFNRRIEAAAHITGRV